MSGQSYCVASAEKIYSEPAYVVPFASFLTPNNPIPAPRPILAPSAPTNLVASSITPNSFVLTWTGVNDAVDYVITWSTFTFIVAAPLTTFTLTGLPESTTANATVTSFNAGGSAISAPISVSTGQNVPTGLRVTNITSNSFLCYWNYIAGVTYTLSWGAFTGTVTGNGTGTFTGLTGQTTNNFIVTANGTTQSAPLSVTTAPDLPTGFAVTRRGTTYLNISWNYFPNVTYNIVFGNYTGTITGNGTGAFRNLPAGYSSAQCQITATNSVASATSPFPAQTLLSPITFDTGQCQEHTSQTGFYLAPLGNPNTFTVPANLDVFNNGTNLSPTSCSVPPNFLTPEGSFVYQPSSGGGLFAYRYVSLTAPNPLPNGFQNDIACYTTGAMFEFSKMYGGPGMPTTWSQTNNWTLVPGDTFTVYLLIAYPAWNYVTDDQPNVDPAYWRISFTYNPFSLT